MGDDDSHSAISELDARISALERVTVAMSVPPPPRPSLAVRAASKTAGLTATSAAVLGALVVIAQLVLPPNATQIGPLTALLQALLAAFDASK